MARHRILFVDDEQNILLGLRRMLRGMRDEWDMTFVDSGAKALAEMAEAPFDAVVSDMRMPGMDGGELLAEAQRLYPSTIRIILSGYSEEESVMRTVGPAHQFIAKPCPAETMVEVISRALELRQALESERLKLLLTALKDLPTPSDTYSALVKHMDHPNASANGVAEIIAGDVAMTAELLRLTNSAYFSVAAKVTTPLQAVRILGFETVRALVTRIGIFRSFRGLPTTGRLMEDLNRDSFLVARIAKRIGKAEGFEIRRLEEAYCAGMLCSIGTLLLLDQLPGEFSATKAAVAAGRDMLEAEIETFGATHLQVGAYLLGLWGFNKTVVEAIAFAGRPSVTAAVRLDAAGAVHAARVLAGASPAYAVAGKSPDLGRLTLDNAYLQQVRKADRLVAWTALAEAERKG